MALFSWEYLDVGQESLIFKERQSDNMLWISCCLFLLILLNVFICFFFIHFEEKYVVSPLMVFFKLIVEYYIRLIKLIDNVADYKIFILSKTFLSFLFELQIRMLLAYEFISLFLVRNYLQKLRLKLT